MTYLALKYLHVSCVVLSGLGFVLRGGWMFGDSPCLQRRLVRTLPHVVDSILLGSAVSLAVLSDQYPWSEGWLGAKLGGLLVYILCGAIALKRGRTRAIRAVFLILALLAYAYIVAVALSRQPLPWR